MPLKYISLCSATFSYEFKNINICIIKDKILDVFAAGGGGRVGALLGGQWDPVHVERGGGAGGHQQEGPHHLVPGTHPDRGQPGVLMNWLLNHIFKLIQLLTNLIEYADIQNNI